MIVVSTDEVLGGESLVHLKEDASLQCTNAYSASKSSAELLCQAYEKSHKLPLIVTRSGNVVGVRQAISKMLPKFICRCLEDLPIEIHGDGKQTRSFLACDDVCKAFLLIISKAPVGNTYNIGTNQEYSVQYVAESVLKEFGRDPQQCIQYVSERLFQDRRYLIDSSKLRALGWEPTETLESILPQTIEWYRTNYRTWWNVDIFDSMKAHPTC